MPAKEGSYQFVRIIPSSSKSGDWISLEKYFGNALGNSQITFIVRIISSFGAPTSTISAGSDSANPRFIKNDPRQGAW